MKTIQDVCQQLGVPLNTEEIEGPSVCLTFLGIILHTKKSELRLPAEKLARIRELLDQRSRVKRLKKHDMLSLIGHLAHACKVVSPGCTYLWCMIDMTCRA